MEIWKFEKWDAFIDILEMKASWEAKMGIARRVLYKNWFFEHQNSYESPHKPAKI